MNCHEAIRSVYELSATLCVFSIRSHWQPIVTLATLSLSNGVHVEPHSYVVCLAESQELRRGLVVVVVYTNTTALHVKLEAVVWVNEDGIHRLLTHNLLHEEDDVAVAVDLVVVDHREVLLHPLVRLLALKVCHVPHLLVHGELHQIHLDGCGAVLRRVDDPLPAMTHS